MEVELDIEPKFCWFCRRPVLAGERANRAPHGGIAVHAQCLRDDAVNEGSRPGSEDRVKEGNYAAYAPHGHPAIGAVCTGSGDRMILPPFCLDARGRRVRQNARLSLLPWQKTVDSRGPHLA